MTTTIVQEAADIFRRLSPQNQAYFMTLVRVAEIAESGVKNTLMEQPRKPSENPPGFVHNPTN